MNIWNSLYHIPIPLLPHTLSPQWKQMLYIQPKNSCTFVDSSFLPIKQILHIIIMLCEKCFQGGRDENSHFIVTKHKDKGYITLQSKIQRGIFLGLTPKGEVRPTVDTGVSNVWLFPEVVECMYGLNCFLINLTSGTNILGIWQDVPEDKRKCQPKVTWHFNVTLV